MLMTLKLFHFKVLQYHFAILLSFCFFLVRAKSSQIRTSPARFKSYWDMSIPTEYYESEFIEFEEFMEVVGLKKESSATKPHATGDHMLEMFHFYKMVKKNESKEELLQEESVELQRKGKKVKRDMQKVSSQQCSEQIDVSIK